MRRPHRALLLGALLLAAGCSRNPYPPYSPHDSLLSIVAEFQLLNAVDPYRDQPARDLTGSGVPRAALVRLANYESLHPGRFSPELRMLRGRALEWLGDYESAERNYAEAAEFDGELAAEANRRASVLRQFNGALAVATNPRDVAAALDAAERSAAAFGRIATETGDAFYKALALREQEAAEVRRAETLAAFRRIIPDGDEQARQALASVISNHRESARALEHALRLARYHRELAEEEMRLNPPAGAWFDRDRFRTNIEASLDLLYRVSQADGRPERLVAMHELDAVLALADLAAGRAQ